jgi:uncharacterized glyoxalase superfamily protein PhnB
MLRNPRYVLAVHDLQRTVRYYRDVLGFRQLDIDAPGWAFLLRDGCYVMAGECADALPAKELGDHSYVAYIEVEEIDAFYAEVLAKGATTIKPLRDEPWRMREFGIRTVDGHRIMFGSPIAP